MNKHHDYIQVWFDAQNQPTCSFCGKTSGTLKDLQKHILTHTNEKEDNWISKYQGLIGGGGVTLITDM